MKIKSLLKNVFQPILLKFKKGLGISHFPSKWTFTVNLPIRRMAKDCTVNARQNEDGL